ncbi:hypothetical protein G6F35_017011 [Rhizopus arrhizus]|nr:hypothetical protein G6F35_017011 [Rhizopus arrhizus]
MPDHQHLARVEHRAVFAQGTQVGAEQLCGEHFAQALHAVQHLARQLADHRQRGQHLGQLLEARVDPFHGIAHLLAQQRHRSTTMARAQRMPGLAPAFVTLGGQLGQLDQRIGDTLHGRDDGDLQRFGAGQ